jgi:hypothetical protein
MQVSQRVRVLVHVREVGYVKAPEYAEYVK